MEQTYQSELEELREVLSDLDFSKEEDRKYAFQVCARLVGQVTGFNQAAVENELIDISWASDRNIALRDPDRLTAYLRRYLELL